MVTKTGNVLKAIFELYKRKGESKVFRNEFKEALTDVGASINDKSVNEYYKVAETDLGVIRMVTPLNSFFIVGSELNKWRSKKKKKSKKSGRSLIPVSCSLRGELKVIKAKYGFRSYDDLIRSFVRCHEKDLE